jgi:hypothetical protein
MVVALAFIAGCDQKSQEPQSPPPEPAKPAASDVSKAVEAAMPAVEATAAQVTTAAKQATAEATATAKTTVADVTTKANALIEQAKTLMGESKYDDALNTLQQLANFKLTPEQDKLVAGLKEQIQKAMAAKATADGASAVGNLLKK